MNINDLTPEQMAKLQECTTPEEILALAKEEGHELTRSRRFLAAITTTANIG